MAATEKIAGMDVLCSDKTGTLTLNKLTVDKNLIEVFAKGVDADTAVLMAALASRTESQDAIEYSHNRRRPGFAVTCCSILGSSRGTGKIKNYLTNSIHVFEYRIISALVIKGLNFGK
ncbi:hypothetical protein ACET3Z_025195 [Daucus carota]